MALGILLIMFVSVSVISVLGVLIMFLSKSTKVKKAAASQRQGEKRLSERIHPGFRVGERRPIRVEKKRVACFGARNGGHEDGKRNKQEKEQRHDDFVGTFDA